MTDQLVSAQDGPRDEEAVARFVDRFALALTDGGFPRMAALVFVALLASDSGRLTSTELSQQLRISAAGVSGAIRYLTQANLAVREREPGSRRDHYRVMDDVFYEVVSHRDQLFPRWVDALRDGIEALGPDSPAGHRLRETAAFFEFLQKELPMVLTRWREQRAGTASRDDDADDAAVG